MQHGHRLLATAEKDALNGLARTFLACARAADVRSVRKAEHTKAEKKAEEAAQLASNQAKEAAKLAKKHAEQAPLLKALAAADARAALAEAAVASMSSKLTALIEAMKEPCQ